MGRVGTRLFAGTQGGNFEGAEPLGMPGWERRLAAVSAQSSYVEKSGRVLYLELPWPYGTLGDSPPTKRPKTLSSKEKKCPPRAVALLSGGLDSTLALRMMKDQGIEVHAVNFYTGFCVVESKRGQGRKNSKGEPYRNEALRAAADVGVEVELVDISKEYMEMVVNPRFGYGANANPCIDCRIFMLKKAREIMEEVGADFIVTGEVLGQRPMSQRRHPMEVIETAAGLQGKIVRPLTARSCAPSDAEKEALVDRERLGRITGRSRKPQMQLARELGIEDYPSPAGGCCYLADEAYARKFYDYLDHLDERHLTARDAIVLATGRHFRIGERAKVIVGRDEEENRVLETHIESETKLFARDFRGPLTLLQGEATEGNLSVAASLAARYGDGKRKPAVCIGVEMHGAERTLTAAPCSDEDLDRWRI